MNEHATRRSPDPVPALRVRQKLGKYRVQKRIGVGGFAHVYRAQDTIEGIPVALKVPHGRLLNREVLSVFRKEVRLVANLDHPNILPIKTADFINDRFVIVTPLGLETLGDRLHRRLSARTAFEYAEQMLDAVAYAHEQRIIHCDLKPDNLILFPDGRLRLSDFGIAKVAQHTRSLKASGTGTLGYLAPEQALGKPSFRSDVFSLGLMIYRMFSGHLPEWPYDWPPEGIERVRQVLPTSFIALLERAMSVDERARFANAIQMQSAFLRLRPKTLQKLSQTRSKKKRAKATTGKNGSWRTVRHREFKRFYGKLLDVRSTCGRCHGPVSESMMHCPWCGRARKTHKGDTSLPNRCNRCHRGMKKDWRFCAWCYGPGCEPDTTRAYSDRRYTARCSNKKCERKDLMPFMRYCPWCHVKVAKKWRIEGSSDNCGRCGWGALPEFWDYCPWCGLHHHRRNSSGR